MSASWRATLGTEFAREGFFDEGVEAARNACVAGAPLAAAAITAAAYYQNPLHGIGALHACMARFATCPHSLQAFREALWRAPLVAGEAPGVPGFGFVNTGVAQAVRNATTALLGPAGSGFPRLLLWQRHADEPDSTLEALNPAGLVALCCLDQGATPSEAERWFLLWRLEPALREAQLARAQGLQRFPFFERVYAYEGAWPAPRTAEVDASLNLTALMEGLGLAR